MPVHPTYPGVYIEEIPSGVHPITGVATSIGAFIDVFTKGPLDTAVHVLSLADFQRIFGGLNVNSEGSYAIQQFFLNGGSEAYVIRIADGAQAAAVTLLESPGGSQVVTLQAATAIGGISTENPGQWGNSIRAEVDFNTSDPTQLFNLTITLIDPNSGQVLQTETFRNLTFQPTAPTYAPDTVNQASQLVQLNPPGGGSFPDSNTWTAAFRPAPTGTLSTALPVSPAIPALNTNPALNGFDVIVDVDGTGATKVTYLATLAYNGTTPKDYPSLRPWVEAAIQTAKLSSGTPPPGLSALLTGASVQLVGNGTKAVPYQFRVLVGRGSPAFNPNAIVTFADVNAAPHDIANQLNLKTAALNNVQQYSLGSGSIGAQSNAPVKGTDGTLPIPPLAAADATAFANAIIGNQANKTGIFALENADLFNILCIPLAANLDTGPPWTNLEAVISAATSYCDYRRAFLILDIPSAVNTVPGMQTFMTQNDTLRDNNNGVYFPRVSIPDPLNNNRLRDVGPSGTVAGLYALTDVNRGVWKAPAGTEAVLRNVSQLIYSLTDGENGVLNPLGINCLRSFPVYGNVCWGARTLEGADVIASDWKYIPVRRLALFLEESLYRGTKWAVFEPNDEPLWAQIRLNVGAFMQDLFRQGAFQGSTPQQAYLVKCDSDTTTSLDQENGIVNIVVGFAPLKPAEFVIIQIQQIAGQLAS